MGGEGEEGWGVEEEEGRKGGGGGGRVERAVQEGMLKLPKGFRSMNANAKTNAKR